MYNKFQLLLLLLLLFIGGCNSSSFHVEREDVIIDIDIRYMLQDKRFKSLEYNTKTGIIKIEKFSSETSEVVANIVKLIDKLKPL